MTPSPQKTVRDMNSTPENQSAQGPQHESGNGEREPTPGEILILVGKCLRRRLGIATEKPKWTDVFTAFLTLPIAVAAFWSAWAFQGQLTEMQTQTTVQREIEMKSDRAWVGLDTPITIDAVEVGSDRVAIKGHCQP